MGYIYRRPAFTKPYIITTNNKPYERYTRSYKTIRIWRDMYIICHELHR